MSLQAYTDGSCSLGNGGWAWIMFWENNPKIIFSDSGGSEKTTNNRMELFALINLIKAVSKMKMNSFEVYIDSQYVLKSIVKDGKGNLYFNSKTNKVNYTGWCRNWKTPKNPDLWKLLDKVLIKYFSNHKSISFSWVKGHSGNFGNDLADKYAQKETFRIKRRCAQIQQ